MEATTRSFTAEEWTEHEQFVQMFRAAKQRKQEWQEKYASPEERKQRAVSMGYDAWKQQVSAASKDTDVTDVTDVS